MHRRKTLQDTATHCNTLRVVACNCNCNLTIYNNISNTLQCTATRSTLSLGSVACICNVGVMSFYVIAMLQHTATQCVLSHCNTLQHTTTYCNTLQHTATPSALLFTLQFVFFSLRERACLQSQHTATHCNTQQHAAARCSTLQHTATLCNTLQHTSFFSIIHKSTKSMSKMLCKGLWKLHVEHDMVAQW